MKRSAWLITLSILVTGLTLIAHVRAQTEGWEEIFFRANQAYKDGRFQGAIDGYGHLLRSGHASPHLYYNLGNSYFKINQLGRAILNYERARLLMPRNSDLNFNLSHARDQTLDAVSEPQDLVNMTFFWLKRLSFGELFWGFATFNCLFWAILLVRFFYRSEWLYYLLLIILVSWIVTGLSLGLKWYEEATDARAVILDKEVDILAGPDSHDTVLFKLHSGTIVYYERTEDGWTLVHLPDKKRGWIKATALEPIIKKG
ncbi:MAG: hypothetical protein HQ561_09400 [Desulfobacteraceae bacterium]|nr:hypothetical protein [Desulfobacteraceae bacterium]